MKEESKTQESKKFLGGKTLLWVGLLLALIGLALVGVGLVISPKQAIFSYLVAFCYGVSISLGALLFLLICYVMRATWPVVLRRLTETVASIIPLFLLLFIPIALYLDTLYSWMRPEEAHGHLHHLLEYKAPYLNGPFFIARSILYLLIFSALSFFFRRASIQRDHDPEKQSNTYGVSAIGLLLLAISLSFASFDWIMSLDPSWFSTIFGVYYFAGGSLGAIAILIILSYQAKRQGLLDGFLTGYHFHALGRILLGFVIFWAYSAYSQGFLIYIANKPEETPWYVLRSENGWDILGYILIFGHFLLPFLILLSRSIKFRPALLSWVAAWLLLLHYVDLYWLIIPELHETPQFHWLDAASMVGILGAMLATGTWLLRNQWMVPKNDPDLEVGRRYHSL